MTIETNLERIATALEGIFKAQALPQIILAEQVTSDKKYVEDTPLIIEKPKTYAEERKAEVKAEVKAEPRKPGRPKKETKPVEEPAAEEDPFAEEPPVVEAKVRDITKDDLRKLMIALRDKVGKDKAYALLREHGNGATFLPGSTASGAGGTGELKPDFFLAVVNAAEEALTG